MMTSDLCHSIARMDCILDAMTLMAFVTDRELSLLLPSLMMCLMIAMTSLIDLMTFAMI